MMRLKKLLSGIFIGTLAAGGLLAAGCDDKAEKVVARQSGTPDSRRDDVAGGVHNSSNDSGSVTVSLLPNRPTAKDDLRLVYSGGKEVGSCYWERNGAHIATTDYECLPRNNFVKGDEIRARVVIDGKEATNVVTIVNSPPEVVAVPFKETRIHRGVDIEVMPEGADFDGDQVQFRYVWTINDETQSLDSPVLGGDQFHKGDHISLTIIPFDGEDEGRAYRGRVFVVPNAPPSFASTPPLRFKAGTYRYQARAEDPDDDAIRYSLETGPAGMSINSDTGLVVWSIDRGQAGEHKVTIVAEDDEGSKAFQEYVVTVSVEE